MKSKMKTQPKGKGRPKHKGPLPRTVNFRVPADFFSEMEAEAESQNRSVNAQIIFLAKERWAQLQSER